LSATLRPHTPGRGGAGPTGLPGRYLEARTLTDDRTLLLDFNYAYNPFCAYGPEWRCSIPPIENHLALAIRAGERTDPDPDSPVADLVG
jgi:uncharacterized protein